MSVVLPASSNLNPELCESRRICNIVFTSGDNVWNTDRCIDQEEKLIPKQLGCSYSISRLNTGS